MNRVTLAPPAVDAERRTAFFQWRVEPATALYHRTCFTLRFPPEVEIGRVPPALWWTVALLCLHAHWNLLRPCRVELPVELAPGEVEFWRRLVEVEAATLEAYRGAAGPDGAPGDPWEARGLSPSAVDLVARGPRLPPLPRLPAGERCAAAFSGGKDSLLQAALLCEFTARPLLVTTTSPMPPLHDHQTARRRQVLTAIAARRDVELLEVESDLRASWRNEFPPLAGYPVAVNEMTDTFLYFSVLLVCAVALGATHLFLASEAELQDNAEVGGRIVQHPHCMYSQATQRAVAALLAPLGLRYGSLISALHSEQVQRLLWTRYADLCDLQYSCWRVGEGESACSRCSQCLRVALGVLALGERPERMGIALVPLLLAMADWQPSESANGALPDAVVRRRLHAQVMSSIAATPPSRVLAAVALGGPARLLRASGWRALAAYARLRRRFAASPPAAVPGYRAGFLGGLDPLLGKRIAAVFADHFVAADSGAYAGVLERSERLARFVAAPLDARNGPAKTAP
jgi:7-cyano-7-deazaguanine synthase in queuosine biosynthesis